MGKELREKLMESLSCVLPLMLFVIALNFALGIFAGRAMPGGMLAQFLIGGVLLIIGMTLVETGAETSMIPMGARMGAFLTQTGKYLLIIICCFLIGALVTMAEPDIAVLAGQFPGVENIKMILTAGAGVGTLLVLGVLRVIKRVPFSLTLLLLYAAAFALSLFEPGRFFAVAFDTGGVATGPIVVPFIMAVGLGLAAVRGGRSAYDDSFGMVAVCSVGPVLFMLLFGIFGKYDLADIAGGHSHAAQGSSVVLEFIHAAPHFLEEVAVALLPIIIFFLIFQFIFLHLSRRSLLKMGVGVIYTFIGHVIFLVGVNVGFLPAGTYLGEALASLPANGRLLLIPVGMLLGSFAVLAEPMAGVLASQVETLTVGAVSKKQMLVALSVGAAVSAGVSMLRVLTGLPLWYFLLGGYALSLALSFIVPKLFTAVAFDSGAVVSGVMTISFLLPFAKGACITLTGSIESVLTDAFGLIALVAVTPVITIQLLGLAYKLSRILHKDPARRAEGEITVIEFDREEA